MIEAISFARRLSRLKTRRLSKLGADNHPIVGATHASPYDLFAAAVQISLFAVHRDVETRGLVGLRRAKRDKQADQLEQDEAHAAAEHDRGSNRHCLDTDLAGIASDQSVEYAVDALLGEDAGQNRAHGSADAMRRDDVERIVE